MDEMYLMAMDIHFFSVLMLILFVSILTLLTKLPLDFKIFSKFFRPVLPLYFSFLAAVTLTGAIMMAAKHLSFSLINIIMIVTFFSIVHLEVMRHNHFKNKLRASDEEQVFYKKKAFMLHGIELVMLVIVTAIAHYGVL